jgi:hypothetical protein
VIAVGLALAADAVEGVVSDMRRGIQRVFRAKSS